MKNRLLFIAVAICVLSIVLEKAGLLRTIRGGVEKILAPQYEWLARSRATVSTFFRQYQPNDENIRRLGELEKKLAQQTVDRAELATLRRENSELLSQLKEVKDKANMFLPATLILGKDVVVTLGRGDGVKVGSMVISNGAYIGTLKETSTHLSKVETLESMDAKLQVTIQGREMTGAILIREGEKLYVAYVDPSVILNEGDILVTVGGSSGVLPDVPIARVTQVLSGSSDPSQKALVEPVISIRNGSVKNGATVLVFANDGNGGSDESGESDGTVEGVGGQ